MNEIIMRSERFSLEDSVIWIAGILPDIPYMVDSNKSEVQFTYRSSFVGTTLVVTCRYADQHADEPQDAQG